MARSPRLAFASFAALVTLASLGGACATRPPLAPAASAEGGAWRYDAIADDGGRELLVSARFPAGTTQEFTLADGASPFVRDAEVSTDGRWRSVAETGGTWRMPECASSDCTVRYRFLLRDAAHALEDLERARTFDGITLARPSVWLMHPTMSRAGTRMRLRVVTPPGTTFATGMYRAPDGSIGTYETDAFVLPAAPYALFGRFDVRRASFSGASIEVASERAKLPVSNAAIDRWIVASASAVGDYYGCFPVPRVLVLLVPTDGDDVVRGHALGDGGAVIVVEIGRGTADYQLHEDWVLPHELVHLGFPSLDPSHHWLEEGVATYVQPIARARAGSIDAPRAWAELARGLPSGAPRDDDRGLDHAPSWKRTYWGGALFFLLADVEIRERTHDRYSLEDALKGIVAAGGNIGVQWDYGRVLDAGDRAVGVPVMRELYDRMGTRASSASVDPLLARLGVGLAARAVSLDDRAPLAGVRRAITARGEARKAPLVACAAARSDGAMSALR